MSAIYSKRYEVVFFAPMHADHIFYTQLLSKCLKSLSTSCKCVCEHGLRSAEKMFGAKNKDWILQEDNDPKHANPIENVWSVVKRKLAEGVHAP